VGEGITVIQILELLSARYGKEFKDYIWNRYGVVKSHLNFLVNGRNIRHLSNLKTKLRDGDVLAIIPPVNSWMKHLNS